MMPYTGNLPMIFPWLSQQKNGHQRYLGRQFPQDLHQVLPAAIRQDPGSAEGVHPWRRGWKDAKEDMQKKIETETETDTETETKTLTD